MFAALYGDAALMKRLLERGADPGASNVAGAPALMWAVPNTDKMRLLLAAGVNVDALSDDRRSALVVAAGMVGAAPAVTLLLEYGASALPATASDPSAMREAAWVDNADVFGVLLDYGANGSAVAVNVLRTNCFECAVAIGAGGAGPVARLPLADSGPRPELPPSASLTRISAAGAATPAAIHAAVERRLPLLQKIGQPFIQKTGCVSCHHNSVAAWTVAEARQNGRRVDEQAAGKERATVATYLESWRERTLRNIPIAGGQDTISYLLVGLGAGRASA